MKKIALAAMLTAGAPLLLLGGGCKNGGPGLGGGGGGPVTLKTDDDKTLYALGLILGRNVGTFNLTPAELAIVQAGLRDSVTNAKPQVELQVWGPKVQQLAMGRANKRAEGEKAGAKEFLEKAAKEEGAQKLPSGLVYKTLKPGTGPSPTADDRVKVHYHGTLTNGTVFDSSVKRNEPAEFPLRGVIPCWTEGVAKMKVGEKAKLVCPSAIAYGDEGRPPVIPGGATLIFEVELLEITSKGAAPQLSLPAGTGGKIELKGGDQKALQDAIEAAKKAAAAGGDKAKPAEPAKAEPAKK